MAAEEHESEPVALENIRFDRVGRVDSVLFNLHAYEFDITKKITLDVALDIIDCFRRGGKLHVKSVHKILKDTYWAMKKLPNVRYATVAGPQQRVSVVGDLHGQFADLLHILDTTGPPSDKNLYVFNGDFVDRGANSLEVALTLFALQLAAPEFVFLNRGNHEDAGICAVFGFMRECLAFYDEVTFSMFVEVFRYLPLATIVNEQVIVLHGGLFSTPGVLVADIQKADRKEYTLANDLNSGTPRGGSPRPGSPRRLSPRDAAPAVDAANTHAYLRQIVKDLLWSDPQPFLGRRANPRGEGVHFGPDVTEEFLRANNLRMVVRSHECVPFGFGQPFEGDKKELLATIFSASDYSGAGNHGAFLRFTASPGIKRSKEVKCLGEKGAVVPAALKSSPKAMGKYIRRGAKTAAAAVVDATPTPITTTPVAMAKPTAATLYYTTHTYYNGSDPLTQERRLRDTTQASLAELILKKKVSLRKAFEDKEADTEKTGRLPLDVWSSVMEDVTKVQVQWKLLLPLLMPTNEPVAEAAASGDDAAGVDNHTTIDYVAFLDGFQLQFMGKASMSATTGKTMFDALYVNRRQLETMFRFFDTDKSGSITRSEFRKGCEALNNVLPAEEKLTGVDRLLDLLDWDRSGTVEMHEFFEGWSCLFSVFPSPLTHTVHTPHSLPIDGFARRQDGRSDRPAKTGQQQHGNTECGVLNVRGRHRTFTKQAIKNKTTENRQNSTSFLSSVMYTTT